MSMTLRIDHQSRLNDCMPVARDAHLGDVLYDLINKHNALIELLEAANITGLDAPTAASLLVARPEERV